MPRQSAFLDSGIFVAFLVRNDRLHEHALALFARPPSRWYTSILVISEAYGWFLNRADEAAARKFRDFLERLPGLDTLHGGAEHTAATWRKLDALRGRKLSFVDGSSLVWLETNDIPIVWGTDHHLGLEGADVTPGPPPA